MPAMAAVLISSLMINVFSISTPIAVLLIYDRVLPNGTGSTLFVLLLSAGVIVLVDAALRLARATILSRAGTRFDHTQREQLVRRYLMRGRTASRVSHAELAESLSANSSIREYRFLLLQSVVDIPFGLAFLVLIAFIGGWLVLIPALVCLSFAAALVFFANSGQAASLTHRRSEIAQAEFASSAFENLRAIKAIAAEVPVVYRFVTGQVASSGHLRRQVLNSLMTRDINAFFSQALIGSVVVASALAVIEGNITLGGLAACTLLAGRALEPLQTGLQLITQRPAFDLARELIAMIAGKREATEQLAPPHAAPLWSVPPRIEVRHLYTGQDGGLVRPIEDLDLDIEPGQFVVVSGDRGTGKSALVRALLRLTPAQGTIRFGDIEITDETADRVRRNVTYIPREPAPPNGRLIDILTDGDENAYADVRYLSHLIGLDEAVKRLPDGYHTEIQRERQNLPRGLLQLAVIVRGLARKQKVMIIDEANFSLDAGSEQRFIQLMGMLKGEATILFISDRPAVKAMADRTLVLSNGRIAVSAYAGAA